VQSPSDAGYHQPAEWITHEACWVAWPHLADEWGINFEQAKKEVAGLCRALSKGAGTGREAPERLRMLVRNDKSEKEARVALRDVPIDFQRMAYGDIWLRDTGPVFLATPEGEIGALRFRFNGWGEKYLFDHDPEVAEWIIRATGVPGFRSSLCLEGGALEVDGAGLCLTTRSCTLNPNRNLGLDERGAEVELRRALGVDAILWLDHGLKNDHTDGHIDTLARFVEPGVIVCMEPRSNDDPNRDTLVSIRKALTQMRDARGRSLTVVTIPSPGRVLDSAGAVLPASYLNYFVGNATVAVPTYGSPADQDAVEGISALFADRRAEGLPAKGILTGGGTFHCITQQQPRGISSASEGLR